MRTQNVALALAFTLASALASTTALAQAAVGGVDPRVYSKARKAEPNAIRDLAALPIDVSVAILEKGPSDALLAPLDAYPKGADTKALRTAEKRALVIGAIHAVANKKPANARALLERQLAVPTGAAKADKVDALVRAEAADQLGALGDDVIPTLVALARDDKDARVREAALAGLGRVRSLAALEALTPFVTDGKDAQKQVAALRALKSLGSRWAWQAKGDIAVGNRVRQRALDLVGTVERTPGNGAAIDEIQKAWKR